MFGSLELCLQALENFVLSHYFYRSPWEFLKR